ncbi:MAG: hypothetical protein R3341_08325 [Methylophaga sp.]|nr:hypothetical protein [Methylophaga sp.]
MEIPGIAPFAGQPTLTNPLNNENRQVGQQTVNQQTSETADTTLVQEQSASALTNVQVVNEAAELTTEGFDPQNPGGTIDLTA